MKPESWVKEQVKKILKKHNAYFFMPAMGQYGRAGVPDFVCCVNGMFLGIETKTLKNKQTELQELEEKNIEKANGLYMVVRENDLDHLNEWIIWAQKQEWETTIPPIRLSEVHYANS